MKYKKYYFDVEMIIDHEIEIMKHKESISTHHVNRGLSLTDVTNLIRNNMVPTEENVKITFNIRGVNY